MTIDRPGTRDPSRSRLIDEWLHEYPDVRWRGLDAALIAFDLSGFTRLAERLAKVGREGAEQLTDTVNRVFGELVDLVLDSDGDVLAFGGDAITAAFEGTAAAARAVEVAAAMMAAVRDQAAHDTPLGRVRLRASAAVHAGTFDAVLLGETQREVVLAGTSTSELVLLESRTPSGQVGVSDTVSAGLDVRAIRRGHDGLSFARLPRVRSGHARPHPANSWTPPDVGEHRAVAVAFMRIPGTDGVSSDRARHVERLCRIGACVERSAREHGVSWLSTDAIAENVKLNLVAGARHASETDAERLARAALEIVEACRDDGVAIGMTTGPVFVAALGGSRRRGVTVMADSVNLAARLMTHAEPASVLVDESVQRALPNAAYSPQSPIHVKGKTRAIQVAQLHRVLERRPAGSQYPLVGRADLASHVIDSIDAGAAVLLVGDAGIGKTRLLDAVVADVGAWHWVRGYAREDDRNHPYAGLRRLVADGLGLDVDAPDRAVGQLRDLLAAAGSELSPWGALLEIAFRTEVDESGMPEVRDSDRATKVADAFATLLLSRRPDAGFAFDDLHWADTPSRAFIHALAAAASRRGVPVLVTQRAGFDVLPGARVIEVGAIDDAALRQLVIAASAAPMTDEAIDRLLRTAGGNTLFALELAAHHHDDFPDSVERVLGARLDRLPLLYRDTLTATAVLGDDLPLDFIAGCLDNAALNEPMAWQRLDEYVLIESRRLTFRSPIMRSVANARLPFRTRRHLHAVAAARLETTEADGSHDGNTVAIARHWDEAGAHTAAWTWCRRAVPVLLAQGALHEAAELAASGTRHADTADVTEGRLALHELEGDTRFRLGQYEAAHSALRNARRFAPEDVDEARLLRKHGDVDAKRGRYTQSLRWLTRAIQLVEVGADDRRQPEMVRALLSRADTFFYQGRATAALGVLDEAVTLVDRAPTDALEAQASLQMEMVCSELRRPDRGAWEARARTAFSRGGDHLGLGNLGLNAGVSAYNEGRWDDAIASYRGGRG